MSASSPHRFEAARGLCVRAACPGAALFLAARYENVRVGFSSLGGRGKPSEAVAEEAAGALLVHRASGAAMDRYLADQILLPLALARSSSSFTCQAATRHLKMPRVINDEYLFADLRGFVAAAYRWQRSALNEIERL